MIRGKLLFAAALSLSSLAAAADRAPAGPQVGDCVIFREGGAGRVFKAPTYWLKGTIAALSAERRLAGVCPRLDKPVAAYTRDDWGRIAASTPCVQDAAEVREVDVLRIRFRIEAWETPWSLQHGSSGWLFRGHFLDQALKAGEEIDMDATWLERCELRP